MSNQAFTGFLIKKTIQEYPVRGEVNYYNDLEDQNLLLFINKKMADLRITNGNKEINAKNLVNLKIKVNPTKSPKQKQKQQTVPEDKIQSTKSEHKKLKYTPVKPEQKVASLLNDEFIKKNVTSSLYQEYKLANLKANLQKMQTQKDYDLCELNYVELDDDEQIQYFLTQICRAHPEIEVGQMLNVNVEHKKLQPKEEDNLKELIEKRLNKEELDKILKHDRQNEEENLVKVYKETRYDQFEPEYRKKNKLRMSTFKIRSQIQEKMFADLISEEMKNKKEEIKQEVFVRSPKKKIYLKQSPLQSKMISHRNSVIIPTRAQTSQQTFYSKQVKRSESEVALKMNDLIERCDSLEKEQKRDKCKIKRKLKILNKEMVKSVRAFSAQYQSYNNEVRHHEGFLKFQNENQFKKKLVGFLMDQVANKGDILSQKAKNENTKRFLRKVSQESI